MNKTISYIYVILSAVCWGFIGFSNRLLTEAGMTLGNRVFVRNFGTLLVLTVVFALFHRQVFRIRLKHLPIFLGSGAYQHPAAERGVLPMPDHVLAVGGGGAAVSGSVLRGAGPAPSSGKHP